MKSLGLDEALFVIPNPIGDPVLDSRLRGNDDDKLPKEGNRSG